MLTWRYGRWWLWRETGRSVAKMIHGVWLRSFSLWKWQRVNDINLNAPCLIKSSVMKWHNHALNGYCMLWDSTCICFVLRALASLAWLGPWHHKDRCSATVAVRWLCGKCYWPEFRVNRWVYSPTGWYWFWYGLVCRVIDLYDKYVITIWWHD